MSDVTVHYWMQFFSALLTPTIAIFGSYIAYRQYITAQNKLKMDLFDRRFAVYDAARKLISSIISSGKATDDALHQFLAGTRETKWLFNEDIEKYLKEQLWDKAVDLNTLEEELKGMSPSDERTIKLRERTDIKKWIIKQLTELESKFTPFMKLSH